MLYSLGSGLNIVKYPKVFTNTKYKEWNIFLNPKDHYISITALGWAGRYNYHEKIILELDSGELGVEGFMASSLQTIWGRVRLNYPLEQSLERVTSDTERILIAKILSNRNKRRSRK